LDPAAPAPPEAILEFEIEEAEVPRLLRHAAVQQSRAGAIRTVACNLVWHDTADGALAAEGVAIGQAQGKSALWQLERLYPNGVLEWLPACVPPVLAEAVTPQLLGHDLPGPLAPAAAFRGRRRTVGLDFGGLAGELGIITGDLRGVAQDQPACRLRLAGPTASVGPLAHALAETLAVRPVRASLAAEALALARGQDVAPRHLGAPSLAPGITTQEAFTCVAAHLADVILHWGRLVPQAASPEPVHQMRVGVRRMRSALAVFRRAAEDDAGECLWVDRLAAALRDLASRLGVARDWDVFITETGAEVQAAFAADRRVDGLMAAAGRKRAAAYAGLQTYLASQDWTRLAITLALLPTELTLLDTPAAGGAARDYAARALERRLKHVLRPGKDISHLPAPDLHDIRKRAKQLRYATEFFAPLFAEKAVRKYLPKLADLQEALGTINDLDVAAGLMRQLEGGADRAFASGVVQGFGAARAARASARVERVWEKFYRATPFWD
jgi:CHAD domain-containing protein